MLLYEGHGYFLLSVFLFVISENNILPTLFDKIQISSPVLVSFRYSEHDDAVAPERYESLLGGDQSISTAHAACDIFFFPAHLLFLLFRLLHTCFASLFQFTARGFSLRQILFLHSSLCG